MRLKLVISELEFKVRPPLRNLKRRFDAINRKMKNKKQAHWKASIILEQWVLRNFATEGGNVGNWPPFAAGGRYINGILDTTAKLLQDTGTLKRSFVPFHSNRNAGIGSYIVYSKPHNEGFGRLPARRMLPDKSKDKELMNKLLLVYEHHVKKALK